jgi:hypothetical protein
MYMPELKGDGTFIMGILYLISRDSNASDIDGGRLCLMLDPGAL